VIAPEVFHRGLLLALRDYRGGFATGDSRLYRAYRGVLDYAEDFEAFVELARRQREDHDPVFGVYKGAEAMILEGMRDLLLTLDSPHLTWARFSISTERASVELAELEHASTYRKLARTFHMRIGQ
jgi:hypothetical protein